MIRVPTQDASNLCKFGLGRRINRPLAAGSARSAPAVEPPYPVGLELRIRNGLPAEPLMVHENDRIFCLPCPQTRIPSFRAASRAFSSAMAMSRFRPPWVWKSACDLARRTSARSVSLCAAFSVLMRSLVYRLDGSA